MDALVRAFEMLLSFDSELFTIVITSLSVSGTAALLASAVGLPLALILTLHKGRGREVARVVLNTLMAMPTVVVGLMVYAMIGRQGPAGDWGMLFTPVGIILGEFLLALPLVTGLAWSALGQVDTRLEKTCRAMCASPVKTGLTLLHEARYGVMAAVVAGFGRVIAEVGVAMMIGGNIKGYTRTMTTAIALETSKGEFELALALGIVLLAVAFSVNLMIHYLQRGRALKVARR